MNYLVIKNTTHSIIKCYARIPQCTASFVYIHHYRVSLATLSYNTYDLFRLDESKWQDFGLYRVSQKKKTC